MVVRELCKTVAVQLFVTKSTVMMLYVKPCWQTLQESRQGRGLVKSRVIGIFELLSQKAAKAKSSAIHPPPIQSTIFTPVAFLNHHPVPSFNVLCYFKNRKFK